MPMATPLILIIDDEEDISLLTAKRIRVAGYAVECYAHGEGAVEIVRKKRPRLILLDIKLPKISGIEIFKILKHDDELRRIPVIFISAMHEDCEYCLHDLGAQGFVPKPYDSQELLTIIDRILRG